MYVSAMSAGHLSMITPQSRWCDIFTIKHPNSSSVFHGTTDTVPAQPVSSEHLLSPPVPGCQGNILSHRHLLSDIRMYLHNNRFLRQDHPELLQAVGFSSPMVSSVMIIIICEQWYPMLPKFRYSFIKGPYATPFCQSLPYKLSFFSLYTASAEAYTPRSRMNHSRLLPDNIPSREPSWSSWWRMQNPVHLTTSPKISWSRSDN